MSSKLNLRTDEARRRIRLVHLQLLPILSGVQRVSLDEFAGLDQRVFEPHLICQSPGPFPEAAAKLGVRCHFAHHLTREINVRRDYAGYREVLQLLREIEPDIVHTHSSKTGLIGRLAAKTAQVRAVVHSVHGFAFPATRSRIKRLVFQGCEYLSGRMCDAIVCLNRSDEKVASDLLRIPLRKVFRIPNGVRLQDFRPVKSIAERTRLRRELLNLDDRPLVMQIGRLWAQKNPESFVRSACALLQKGMEANFVLVGDGPLKGELSNMIEQAGVAHRVHLLGWRNDVKQILPLADMLVLSSRWEGMPLVILEANASAVPAIATDIPGSRDCIADGLTGLLARPDDHKDLSAKIKYLIDNPEIARAMSTKCYDHVQAFHNISVRHELMTKLYALIFQRNGMPDAADMILESIDRAATTRRKTAAPHWANLTDDESFSAFGETPAGLSVPQ